MNFNDYPAVPGGEGAQQDSPHAPGPTFPTPNVKHSKALFTSFGEMMEESVEIHPLIGDIIERGCTCQIFGPSGHGKTFIALDMALSVATGGLWNGIQCEKGLVFYFNGEAWGGFKRRCRAWRKHHGVTGQIGFHSSRTAIGFDANSIEQAVSEVKALEKQSGQKVAFIVIDTLARHIIGNENDTRGMSDFIRTVDGLRDMFPGSTVLVVHHTGNNAETTNRSRGSSALKGALDVEMSCMDYTLTFTKTKDAEIPPSVDFKWQIVSVGTKPNGDQITSCAVVYGEKPTGALKAAAEKVSDPAKTLLEIIQKHHTGEVEAIRELFYEREKIRLNKPDRKPDSQKTAFNRAIKSLIEQKLITQKGTILQTGQTGQDGTNGALYRVGNGTDGTHTLKSVPDVPMNCTDITPDGYASFLDVETAMTVPAEVYPGADTSPACSDAGYEQFPAAEIINFNF